MICVARYARARVSHVAYARLHFESQSRVPSRNDARARIPRDARIPTRDARRAAPRGIDVKTTHHHSYRIARTEFNAHADAPFTIVSTAMPWVGISE